MLNLRQFIALLLIGRSPAFGDSYGLTKVLAWKFGIIEMTELIAELQAEEMILARYEKGIGYFQLTPKADAFVKMNSEQGRALMLETYPSEHDFINLIFEPAK